VRIQMLQETHGTSAVDTAAKHTAAVRDLEQNIRRTEYAHTSESTVSLILSLFWLQAGIKHRATAGAKLARGLRKLARGGTRPVLASLRHRVVIVLRVQDLNSSQTNAVDLSMKLTETTRQLTELGEDHKTLTQVAPGLMTTQHLSIRFLPRNSRRHSRHVA